MVRCAPCTVLRASSRPHALTRMLLSASLLLSAEPESAPLRVAMLLSGGVDSSLALNLAVAAGHSVTAFYLQIWFEEDFRNFWDACPWEEDLAYARAVCDQARVQLKVRRTSCASCLACDVCSPPRLTPGRWCRSRGSTGSASYRPAWRTLRRGARQTRTCYATAASSLAPFWNISRPNIRARSTESRAGITRA